MIDKVNPNTSNIQQPNGTNPEPAVEISPEPQAGAPPTGGDPPSQKPRKKKKRKSWVWYYFLFMSLLTLCGIAYIDYQRTNYVLGGGPMQTFKRYRTAVKEKRWADAYAFFSKQYMNKLNRCLTRNEDLGKTGSEAFEIQMEYVNHLGGKDVLLWDIDVVNAGTLDHYDEATDTVFVKSPDDYIGYSFRSNPRPGCMIKFKMVKTEAGWKIHSQYPMAAGDSSPAIMRR